MWKTPEFNWLFGNVLHERMKYEAKHPEICWSQLTRKLLNDDKLESNWATVIRAFRSALINPEVAPTKTATDLALTAPDFDGELLDALSEWMACARLQALGFDSFQVVVPPPPKKGVSPCSPDFLASFRGAPAAIEVKNLRPHECVEEMMPEMFYDEKLKGLAVHQVRLVVLRSFRGTLNEPEKDRLRNVVRMIPSIPLGKVKREQLSGRAEAVFRLIHGSGDAICHDQIGFDDLDRDIDAYEGLIKKIASHLSKALRQLSSSSALNVNTRVVAMRWHVPYVSFPFPEALKQAVLQTFEKARADSNVSADLHLFTDWDYVLASTL